MSDLKSPATMIERVHAIASDYFQLKVTAKKLPGEIDLNFYLLSETGEEYILKIAHSDADQENLALQNELMQFLAIKKLPLALPVVLPNKQGDFITKIEDWYDGIRFVRLLTWVPGRIYAKVNPQGPELLESLGKALGLIDTALEGFDHTGAHRQFKWDNAQAAWVEPYLSVISDQNQEQLARHFFQQFVAIQPTLETLRKGVIYNDANDYNLLVDDKLRTPSILGLIDFGDATYTPIINELAIAIAYAAMGQTDPLEAACHIVKGYHEVLPLEAEEIAVLYTLVATRLLVSVVNSAINKKEHPENAYLLISEKPAWEVLEKWQQIPPKFAAYSFRAACGLIPCPTQSVFETWVANSQPSFSSLAITNWKNHALDLSVGSLDLGNNSDFDTIEAFKDKIDQLLRQANVEAAHGGYAEIRPFYSTDHYIESSNAGPRWRTMHLGLDIWAKAGTSVTAFYKGKVHSFGNRAYERDYGPVIILEHTISEALTFYTLYGHLTIASLTNLKVGQEFETGAEIAQIGPAPENGNWPPHLHFQLMLDLLDNEGDFPGVAFVEQAAIWKSICPDPGPLLGLSPNDAATYSKEQILDKRKRFLGKSLSVSYAEPLKMVRGYGQYLYDNTGRRFLDTANNVPHVGHQHPRVVAAAQKQIGVLNTNTRYLHDTIIEYAEALLATFPPELSVVHFVNSGSEANELALRMAKIYSGQKDMLVEEVGYHGNTGACIDISSYKFDGKGGQGAPEHIHVLPIPDSYRGMYRGDDPAVALKYAAHVKSTIEALKEKERGIAGFICESILSCGGQIVLPKGYLKMAYQYVRAAGGLCIADEVQVGFGRVGSHFWGFELQDVVPDIVTMGKPIGNGHPLAAVVTTQAVAEAFANGMEFFNTFGGNPVSCAIGKEVLQIIKDEKLQEHAATTGAYMREQFLDLKSKYPLIGDVRGPGFFQGVELVKDQNTLEPAADQCTYIANRMRAHGILMSTDGPYHNVLKIKPPMLFDRDNVDLMVYTLEKVLAEDFCSVENLV